MKTKILSMSFAALAIMMAACSSDISTEPNAPSGKGDSILRLDMQKQDLTRGVITSTSFEKGDSVFVIIRDTQNTDVLSFTSAAVYDGTEWIFENPIDLSAETESGLTWTSANVEVYYPYRKFLLAYDPEDPNRIILNDKGHNLLEQQDLLYGKASGINKNNPTAKVSCRHLKTRLTFSLKNNSDKPVSFESLSADTEGVQPFLGVAGYVQNGYLYVPEEYTKIWEYSWGYNIEIPAGETYDLDILIPPTDLAYEMMHEKMDQEGIPPTILKFSLEGTRTVNFDIEAYPWGPNTQYIYPVNIGGLPEVEPKKIHMYDTYDGKHVYWADVNIGATSESDYGRLFGWADPSGKLTSENLDDYPSANPPSDIAGTQYDIATVNWGGNWKMPSNSDCWDLKVHATSEWANVNGVNGVRVTSNETGNSIFIPEAPVRVGSVVTFDGRVDYWLADLTNEDTNKAGTLYFSYNEMYSNPLAFYPTAGLERYKGLPVRAICIED